LIERTVRSPNAISYAHPREPTICFAVIFPQSARSATLTSRNLALVSDKTSTEARLFIPLSPQKQNAQPLSHAFC
jgi:hypothetical protein